MVSVMKKDSGGREYAVLGTVGREGLRSQEQTQAVCVSMCISVQPEINN